MTTDTKVCPECGREMLAVEADLGNNVTPTPAEWWCDCGHAEPINAAAEPKGA